MPHRITRDEGGIVRAPAPSMVLQVAVAPGDLVAAGDRVAVLEAMKTEMPILAPIAGRVRSVLVTANVQVEAGAALLVLDPTEPEPERVDQAADDVRFDLLAGVSGPADEERAPFETLRRLILGYDVEPGEARRLMADWSRGADCTGRRRGEDELLVLFADVHGLFEPRRIDDDPEGQEWLSAQEYVLTYVRTLDAERGELPGWFVERLRRALAHHGMTSLERSASLDESWLRIYRSHQRVEEQVAVVMRILERRLDASLREGADGSGAVLDRLIALGGAGYPALGDLARELRYRWHDRPLFEQARAAVYAEVETRLAALARDDDGRADHVRWLVDCPQPLVGLLCPHLGAAPPPLRRTMLEVLVRRYYRIRDLERLDVRDADGRSCAVAEYGFDGRRIHLFATHAAYAHLDDAARALAALIADVPADHDVVVDFFVCRGAPSEDPDAVAGVVRAVLDGAGFARPLRRIVAVVATEGQGPGMGDVLHFTYRPQADGYAEERVYRGLHPMMGKRLHLWRLRNFDIERLPSAEDVYLFRAVARENPKDERLFALAEVRDLTPVRDAAGRVVQLPHLERMLSEALAAIRSHQAQRPPERRLYWNRVLLYVWPALALTSWELDHMVRKLAPATAGLGLEKVVLRARLPDPARGALEDTVLQVTNPGGRGFAITAQPPAEVPIRALTEYAQKVVRLRRLGLTYPYEIVRMLTPPEGSSADFPAGDFVEHDLDAVRAPRAGHAAAGTERRQPGRRRHPQPDGPPSRGHDAGLPARRSEPQHGRAGRARMPPHHRGARPRRADARAAGVVRRVRGREDLDGERHREHGLDRGRAAAPDRVHAGGRRGQRGRRRHQRRRAALLERRGDDAYAHPRHPRHDPRGRDGAHGQAGTRLLGRRLRRGQLRHRRLRAHHGTERAGAVLGPGSRRRVPHPLPALRARLRAPGERFPRGAPTADPVERDVRTAIHGDGFARVGDIFSDEHNPGRKRPFDVRKVMAATIDQDHPPLERWAAMRDAEVAVVWDAHLGGHAVCLIGIESRPVPRLGLVPADGPEQWTAGTLFPRASKKVARAINTASGNRPVVVLANLSGFDGSPESLRELQLEYGAEIGRAVVNFDGPIVFCVISRYHGGAYVVFSRMLNESVEVAAVEGSYASVIGGAPAAAVVFAGEVDARTRRDPRVAALEAEIAKADGPGKARRRAALGEVWAAVHAEKLGEVAREFDAVHSVHRALRVGSLHRIIPAATLRPYLVDAVERGMRHTLEAAGRHAAGLEAP